ncbi:MAG: TAXI family TRAP transporter solute-binding subunit [Pseudomonadota bacterium]
MSLFSRVAVLLGLLLALSTPASAAEFLNVLTGGTSGVYYPLGVAIANGVCHARPGAKCTTQATKASVENLNLLETGKGEVAFTLGDSLSSAWEGDAEAGFNIPLKKLRGISALYPNYIHIVVRADAGVKTLADLKGKRISVGAPKSGTELNARAILKAAGLSYEDFSKVEYLSYAESVELMKNRQLDVTLLSSGAGVSALRDLATSLEVVFLPVSDEIIAKIGDSAYVPGVIPANTYTGQAEDVHTAAVINFLVSSTNVSDDLAYQITKTLYTNLDGLVAAHSAAKGIKLENAVKNMPVPLHPGAEKYYREIKLIK